MGDWIWKLVFAIVVIGCSGSCFCYGNWIKRQKKAVGFWANKPFEEDRITDISWYNRECGMIFQIFSPAPGLAGVAMLLSFEILSVAILGLWATIGILLLIRAYKSIENKYMV